MTFEQSVSWWCYSILGVDPLDLIQTCKTIGYTGFELAPVEEFASDTRPRHEDCSASIARAADSRHQP